jgi:hypothetical protein
MATDAEVTSSIASHAAAADPHTGYLKESEFGAAGKNAIINGGMDIWQRGTSFTVANNTYLMDRWYNTGDTNLTVTRDTDVPTDPYFQYSAKLVGTGTQSITQKIESANALRFAGKVITISLYAKKTSGTGALNINLYYPSTKDNYSSLTQIGSALQMSSNPGSSWARYSVTSSVLPSQVQNGLAVLIDNVNSHTIFITGVQVEVGSVATPYSMSSGTLAGELAACQRYYYRKNASSSGPYAVFAFGSGVETSTFAVGYMQIPVPLRSYPSSIEYGGTLRIVPFAGAESNVSAISLQDRTGTETISIGFTGTGMTSGSYCYIRANNSSTAYIGVSAEL